MCCLVVGFFFASVANNGNKTKHRRRPPEIKQRQHQATADTNRSESATNKKAESRESWAWVSSMPRSTLGHCTTFVQAVTLDWEEIDWEEIANFGGL